MALLSLFSVGLTVKLKVGIYNQIPDLNGDGLKSYKDLIEDGFNNDDHSINAVVNDDYNPYGNLKEFLSADGFDLIEMDTANLKEVVDNDLVIEVPNGLPDDLLPSAISAVVINGRLYAYPTLVCGNFMISLTPQKEHCDLTQARSDFDHLFSVMEQCREEVSADVYERVIGGKMNDAGGWYLPFLYLDGYIDVHGSQALDDAIDELTRGIVDPNLCERLTWLISNCNDLQGDGQNKCYVNFKGSYVEKSDNIYPDVGNYKTYVYFGFSEKVAQIERDSERTTTAAISGPLGPQNILLQFTDALVINKARWNTASDEKRKAILQFVTYFMSNSLRTQIAMGKDLSPPRVRYLLQASQAFYEETSNPIYQQIFWALTRAVPAPSLSSSQLGAIQQVLSSRCVKVPEENAAHHGKSREEL